MCFLWTSYHDLHILLHPMKIFHNTYISYYYFLVIYYCFIVFTFFILWIISHSVAKHSINILWCHDCLLTFSMDIILMPTVHVHYAKLFSFLTCPCSFPVLEKLHVTLQWPMSKASWIGDIYNLHILVWWINYCKIIVILTLNILLLFNIKCSFVVLLRPSPLHISNLLKIEKYFA